MYCTVEVWQNLWPFFLFDRHAVLEIICLCVLSPCMVRPCEIFAHQRGQEYL